jgi:hypothetical protein
MAASWWADLAARSRAQRGGRATGTFYFVFDCTFWAHERPTRAGGARAGVVRSRNALTVRLLWGYRGVRVAREGHGEGEARAVGDARDTVHVLRARREHVEPASQRGNLRTAHGRACEPHLPARGTTTSTSCPSTNSNKPPCPTGVCQLSSSPPRAIAVARAHLEVGAVVVEVDKTGVRKAAVLRDGALIEHAFAQRVSLPGSCLCASASTRRSSCARACWPICERRTGAW